MRALVVGIHAFLHSLAKTWMAGSSPAMTSDLLRPKEKAPTRRGKTGRGLLVRSYLAHIRLRGARTDRSGRHSPGMSVPESRCPPQVRGRRFPDHAVTPRPERYDACAARPARSGRSPRCGAIGVLIAAA